MNKNVDIEELQKNYNGLYTLAEEQVCDNAIKNKLWQKFLRVVLSENGNIVIKPSSPYGYAACRDCKQICSLGPRGGTKELEKHKCQPRRENLVVTDPNNKDDVPR